MTRQPRVSVIIPCYNGAKTIENTIAGVRSQTYRNYELIVVDDGSSDASPAILKTMPDVRLLIQSNQGVSLARNRGAAAAQGDLLAFLDADDRWHPQKLDLQVKAWDDRPTAGIIGCAHTRDHTDLSQFYPPDQPLPVKELSWYDLLVFCRFIPSAVLIPQAVFRASGGFDPRLRCGEDRDLWLRIAYRHPVFRIEHPLFHYDQAPSGAANRLWTTGLITTVLSAERWNPKRQPTLDTAGTVDPRRYRKAFRFLVIRVAKSLLKNNYHRTVPNLFDAYWERFSDSLGNHAAWIRQALLFRNAVKYPRRRNSPPPSSEAVAELIGLIQSRL